jgi:hypothetical protein
MRSRLLVASLLTVAVACTSDDLASRPEPPALTVTSPARGTMREGLSSVEVIGTVGASATGSAAASVSVNGIDAPLAADGSFRVTVPVHAGTNLISTVALSADGGRADDMRGVLTGTFRPATATVENAIAAQLSAQTFEVLGNTAETLIAQTDLNMLVMPYNPVIAKGLSNGEEDCLYGKVSVRQGLDLDHADIALVPGDAGLALDATLHQLYIPLHARYAAACASTASTEHHDQRHHRAPARHDRGRPSTPAASTSSWSRPTVTFTGFDVDASGLPGAVISLLDLDNEIRNGCSPMPDREVHRPDGRGHHRQHPRRSADRSTVLGKDAHRRGRRRRHRLRQPPAPRWCSTPR